MKTLTKIWNWILGKTNIDEKVMETVSQVKKEVE